MSYCRNCGNKIPEGATFCPNCGSPVAPTAETRLAGWGDRFVAYLIDVIILGAILAPIRLFATWILLPWETWMPGFVSWIPFVSWGPSSVIYFLYWTFTEGTYGQSIGKMAMKIKVTRVNNQPVDIVTAALESLGKAFLLPIDLIIGWILYPAKRQRLFNNISNTIVVKTHR